VMGAAPVFGFVVVEPVCGGGPFDASPCAS
jgi:hypothetical protein